MFLGEALLSQFHIPLSKLVLVFHGGLGPTLDLAGPLVRVGSIGRRHEAH